MSIDNFLKNKSAFTYIELLIVVTVILVMSGVGMVSFSSFSQKSRDNRRRTDIEMIRNALNLYYSNQVGGFYPTSLNVLVNEGYLDQRPTDPINRPGGYGYLPLPLTCTNTPNNFCTSYRIDTVFEVDDSTYTVRPENIDSLQ